MVTLNASQVRQIPRVFREVEALEGILTTLESRMELLESVRSAVPSVVAKTVDEDDSMSPLARRLSAIYSRLLRIDNAMADLEI